MSTDYFRGCRKAYAGILKAVAANNIIALLLVGSPIYYILGLSLSFLNQQNRYYYLENYMKVGWSFMGVLMGAWLVAAFALWKVMPNLLTLSIFVYKSIGYWCLVSACIAIVNIQSNIYEGILSYILWGLFPSVIILLMCGDILRSARSRMYETLESPTRTPELPITDTTVQERFCVPGPWLPPPKVEGATAVNVNAVDNSNSSKPA